MQTAFSSVRAAWLMVALAGLAGRAELALAQSDEPADDPLEGLGDEPTEAPADAPADAPLDEPMEAPAEEPLDAVPSDAAPEGGASQAVSAGDAAAKAEQSASANIAGRADRAAADTKAGRASIGSRAARHRVPRTMVPVAVLSGRDLAGLSGPDLYNTAWLHNLGPDRVLVLVNGKRRHQRAPITLSESNDKGQSGTDLNGIPIAAIERVEILSDGAAALYGPSAIGGVINIVLKDSTRLEGSVTGGNYYDNDGNAVLGLDRAEASANVGFELGDKGFVNLTVAARDRGETNRAAIADVPVGTELRVIGGTYLHKGRSCPVDPSIDSNMDMIPDGWITPCEKVRRLRLGNSDGHDIYVFANSEYELTPEVAAYLFGGYSHRTGESGAGLFLASGGSRTPDGRRTGNGLYPDGYLPNLLTTAEDLAATLGFRFELGGEWELDVSAGYGHNRTSYDVSNSVNLSYYYEPDPAKVGLPPPIAVYGRSPTEAYSGQLTNREITANADLTTSFDVLETLSLAGGAELRLDNYQIEKGELVSYAYTRQDNFEAYVDMPINNFDATLISPVEGGIQGFPGFRPDEEVSEGRLGWDVYLQAEQGLTEWWTLSATGRLNSIQFTGGAIVGHLGTRFDIGDSLTLRASGATGSRSPGVQQIYYSQTSTVITGQGLREAITVGDADRSRRRLFQIGKLKPEKTTSGSAGLVFHPELGGVTRKLQLGGDGFVVQIKDRIVLSDPVTGNPPETLAGAPPEMETPGRAMFRDLLDQRLLGAAQFFINPANTTTLGVDLQGVWGFGSGDFNQDLFAGLNYAETTVETIAPASQLVTVADLFGPRQRSRLAKGLPRVRGTLGEATNYGPVTLRVALNHFGSVTGKAFMAIDEERVWSAKWLTDASLSWAIIPELTLTIGADNLFDVYPDKWGQVDDMGNITNEYQMIGFQYGLETHPFGYNGGFYYANLAFSGDYW